jgi:hypothetical protein
MFAPNPQIEDGRFALIGRGHDATSRDILEEVVGPADPMAMNHRWLLYLLDLQARSTPAELDALLSYGCRQSRPRPAEVELRFTHFDRLEGGRTTPPVTDVLRTLTCPQ